MAPQAEVSGDAVMCEMMNMFETFGAERAAAMMMVGSSFLPKARDKAKQTELAGLLPKSQIVRMLLCHWVPDKAVALILGYMS